MAKIALMIFGPPGSGKGTQANLAAGKLDLIHFDTGKYLREYLHSPANKNKLGVQKERKLNDSGRLNTPSFVARIAIAGVTKIAEAGYGVVFSGSPRTLYEVEKIMPILERLYGKKNIKSVILRVNSVTSLKRNGSRKVCKTCGMTILQTLMPHPEHLKFCPFCGSKIEKRRDDNLNVIRLRLKEYENRTKPLFGYLKKRGYCVREINGEPVPYKVSEKILKSIGFK